MNARWVRRLLFDLLPYEDDGRVQSLVEERGPMSVPEIAAESGLTVDEVQTALEDAEDKGGLEALRNLRRQRKAK